MAHTLTSLRNIRKNDKRRARNKSRRSALRSQMKKVVDALGRKDAKVSAEELKIAYALLDRAANSGLLHRNAVARYKSSLARRVNAAGSAT